MRRLAIFFVLLAVHPATGQEAAPLPRERPPATGSQDDAPPVPAVPVPRPRPDPAAGSDAAATTDADATDATEAAGAAVPAEDAAPPRVYQSACPAVIEARVEARLLEPLADGACGERSPLGVSALLVNGRLVPLSSEAIVNCGMAAALPAWAEAVDGYLWARENTRLARILIGTSYMCRPRNRAAGADVSEHGFANALDVIGFELEDGRTMALPGGWSEPLSPAGRLLRFAHHAACADFTTTLGPEANALHADHLHLDLGCHGQSCTARLCE